MFVSYNKSPPNPRKMTAPKGARVAFHPTTKSQWAFTLPSHSVIYRPVKPDNTWSTLGTTVSNAVANTGPIVSMFGWQNTNPQKNNQSIQNP
jgi:hypothetical protein